MVHCLWQSRYRKCECRNCFGNLFRIRPFRFEEYGISSWKAGGSEELPKRTEKASCWFRHKVKEMPRDDNWWRSALRIPRIATRRYANIVDETIRHIELLVLKNCRHRYKRYRWRRKQRTLSEWVYQRWRKATTRNTTVKHQWTNPSDAQGARNLR